ncbi:hypothetical protein [Bradyrhizobium sp. LHD-71]|uniref:hypothetical protein n=1 Tax=Bradyrhizobium sp. LHD-71 TaxID=3072141 RepID=UPI00280C91F1|nr:hypothetical protein [Bradyrhizobium sp. LHD-71]MDQ8727963.1 hypothetical protein [Bradyrhizobium sp. LHD-71]
MRLNATQVEQTLAQFDASVVPDDHPIGSELHKFFGDHTFFLDSSGLNILEAVEMQDADAKAGEVVNLAYWSDATLTSLRPHEPEPTGVVIVLDVKH